MARLAYIQLFDKRYAELGKGRRDLRRLCFCAGWQGGKIWKSGAS